MSQILIVEDEDRISSFVAKGLRSAGYVPTVADNGRDGYQLAQTGDFELIVLDLGLPDQDGFTVLRRLRESKNSTPVIILSARSSVDDTVAGLEGGQMTDQEALQSIAAIAEWVLETAPGARADCGDVVRRLERMTARVDFEALGDREAQDLFAEVLGVLEGMEA